MKWKKCKHENTMKQEKYEETQIWCNDCNELIYSEDNLK
jgi:formylmethanofuran dehydrogenase subunit E